MLLVILLFFQSFTSFSQNIDLQKVFQNPPESARPWVFWYWMHAAITREGITADLQAMKDAGIGGAYLVPIKSAVNPPFINPPVETLTPEWWNMLRFTMKEAKRLNIKIAMHASDGFATAGGPWITPEFSMQKVVWTEIHVTGEKQIDQIIPQPQGYKDYYRDIAVLAFPSSPEVEISTSVIQPKISTSLSNTNVSFLADEQGKGSLKATEPCWIQYEFEKPFTCRSVTIRANGTDFQSQRLLIKVSDDGINFRDATRLIPYRHGWFEYTSGIATYSLEAVTARYFRFYYDKEGTEPAAEDLDNAKWNPYLRIRSIKLSSAPKINQYEGKNGSMWRLGLPSDHETIPDSLCISQNQIINITGNMDAGGRLKWDVPDGHWTILRIGYTSTGTVNATAGAGKGLECDKLNPEAVKFQFDHWFGETMRQLGTEYVPDVLKIIHVDSWECGSQNWSPVFREEFQKRRGYDPVMFLPAFAGIPVQSAEVSESFLYDIRKTISELMADNFYGTLKDPAASHGLVFTGESVAPVMMSDGMLHYKYLDVPMGEFWVNSPSHDKPTDMIEAVSAAHVYGKPVVQSEAFTTLRTDWSEYPGSLKTLGDRNFALGINRFVNHVFVHNPWPDRKPGMTLDGIGMYFQRDQTWWKAGYEWIKYIQRCQSMLQQGDYVADIAVFTGEEFPRRALLPDRLVSTLPGLFGDEVVRNEARRMKNEGVPTRKASGIVTITSNMAEPEKWVNPLRGYAYDAINPDAILRLAKVENGRIVLPGGASFGILVIPGSHPMHPDSTAMSPEIAEKLIQMVKDGATVLIKNRPTHSIHNNPEENARVQKLTGELFSGDSYKMNGNRIRNFGKGKIMEGAYISETFSGIGIQRDVEVTDTAGKYGRDVAWTHRTSGDFDIYFISNQLESPRSLNFAFRTTGRIPELWDAVNGEMKILQNWKTENGRTYIPLDLDANASAFIIFRKKAEVSQSTGSNAEKFIEFQTLTGSWNVAFDPALGGPGKPVIFEKLSDWSENDSAGIKYYSGTAVYSKSFELKNVPKGQRFWLDPGRIYNIAEVLVNGVSCGVAWTYPYRIEITKALRVGANDLQIKVTNTWANRLIGDHLLPENERITKTNAPFLLEGKPLLKAGLLGPVRIVVRQ